MKKFNYKVANLEVRSVSKYLLNNGEHVTAEIVLWHKHGKSCHTIAYWKKGSEGFDLHLVGSRPFKVQELFFFQVAKIGQDHLDKYFEEMEAEDE